MPRRVITAPGHDRKISLGWLATWWIESLTVHGPGDIVGQPVRFGDEYTGFIVDCYALNGVTGRRLYDSAFLSRPKGCDKSGMAAKIALFEAFGPSRFAGWAKGGETYELLGQVYTYKAGEPMGRAVKAPYVRILATEEEQTGNTFATIYLNLTSSAAPLFELKAWGVVTGLSRIVIPGGGQIVRSTSGSSSKDGGLETFVVFDETHLYNNPKLREMYNIVRGNLGKRSKSAEPWFLETTTMYAPGEDSVAEETLNYATAIEEGRARRPRLLVDHRWGEVKDLRNEDELRAGFIDAYGDAIEWNPVEELINRAYDPRQDEARTRRFFLNAVTSAANAWMEVERWSQRGRVFLRSLERKEPTAESAFVRPWDGDLITLGFDGSSTDDATALVAVRVRDKYAFPLLIEETPDGPEAEHYEVDRDKVDAAVARAFRRFTVVAFYADPPLWQDYVDAWGREYGKQLVVQAGPKHPIAWWTKRDVQMATALERLHTAVVSGTMAHDDDTRLGKVLTRHVHNSRKWSRRGGTVIGKETKNSPKKIDAAVALALAFEGCADYETKRPASASVFIPFSVR
jgi:phage terminase large subunit-like protein